MGEIRNLRWWIGWLSSYLIRRGLTIDISRKIALATSAAMMPASLLIAASLYTDYSLH